ncbi:Zinc finger CCCH domain-containing protein 13, partial [Ophiophagus hannah]
TEGGKEVRKKERGRGGREKEREGREKERKKEGGEKEREKRGTEGRKKGREGREKEGREGKTNEIWMDGWIDRGREGRRERKRRGRKDHKLSAIQGWKGPWRSFSPTPCSKSIVKVSFSLLTHPVTWPPSHAHQATPTELVVKKFESHSWWNSHLRIRRLIHRLKKNKKLHIGDRKGIRPVNTQFHSAAQIPPRKGLWGH